MKSGNASKRKPKRLKTMKIFIIAIISIFAVFGTVNGASISNERIADSPSENKNHGVKNQTCK